MRPIDADALQQAFNEVTTSLMRNPALTKDSEHMVRAFLMTTEMIKDAPTIDHRDMIVKAHWEECDYKTFEHGEIETHYGKGFCCSLCRCGFKKDELKYRNFCPSCGAKMDGD
jgi:hypothetical protein